MSLQSEVDFAVLGTDAGRWFSCSSCAPIRHMSRMPSDDSGLAAGPETNRSTVRSPGSATIPALASAIASATAPEMIMPRRENVEPTACSGCPAGRRRCPPQVQP